MGHNTHFLCVEAKDGKAALARAECKLDGWGDSNNWRSFLRAISEKGKVVEGEKGPRAENVVNQSPSADKKSS